MRSEQTIVVACAAMVAADALALVAHSHSLAELMPVANKSRRGTCQTDDTLRPRVGQPRG